MKNVFCGVVGFLVGFSVWGLWLSQGSSLKEAEREKREPVRVHITYGRHIDFLLNIARSGRGFEHQIGGSVSRERIAHLRRVWERYENLLLPEMQRIMGLSFASPRIDVFVVQVAGVPVSKPVTIPVESTESEPHFIGTLTHELIHALMIDNEERFSQPWDRDGFGHIFETMFPGVDPKIACHVVIFAALRHLFSETVPDAQVLAEQRQLNGEGADVYGQAWRMAERHAYYQALRSFRVNLRNHGMK